MAGSSAIPLHVNIPICTDCGKYTDLEQCRVDKHRLSHVGYDISQSQNDSLAVQRVEDIKRHGRRLLGEA